MRGLRSAWLPALGLLLVLAGCAAPRSEPYAEEATGVVSERTGLEPHWRQGAPATADEEARVASLLARPLGERGAVEIALIRNRRIQALLERAVGGALAARAEAEPGNPVVDFFVRWPHAGGGPVIDAGLAFGLLDLLRLPGRRDAADLEARAGALEAAEEIVGAIGEARASWFEAVGARERRALDEVVAESAAIAADLAERQEAAGTLPALDAHRHRAFADETLLALERSGAEAGAAAERLVRALGLFGREARILLPAGLPPLSPGGMEAADLEMEAVRRRIDLEGARVEVLRARVAAGMAADQRLLPDLEAGVAFERESDGARSTGPGVSVTLPLSGREAALSASAMAAAREAEDRLHDLAVRIRSEVREAAAALASALAVADRYRSVIVPRRSAMVEESQLLYNGMLIGVYDLLAEKREELRARREGMESIRDAWLARLHLEEVLGGGAVPAEDGDGPAPALEDRGNEGMGTGEDPHRGHRMGGGR